MDSPSLRTPYKPLVITYQAQETPHLCYCLRPFPLKYYFNLSRVHCNTLGWDDMSKKLYLFEPKLVLGQLVVQLVYSEYLQYHPQVISMFFPSPRVDKNVINEDDNKLIQPGSKSPIHVIYEYSRCIRHSKWHDHIFIVAVSWPECCLFHILWPH